MFDLTVKRLFWKELRTQSHIWASLMVGALLLQLLFLIRGLGLGVEYPFYVGLVLSACYAVTSSAILFAGEREEQTDEWLRQLPLSAGRLLVGKGLFLLASVVGFALVASGIAAILSQVGGQGHRSYGLWDDQRDMTLNFTLVILGLTAWGVFYSLLLSRVMAVLFASAATHLTLSAIVGSYLPKPFDAWMAGIAVLVAIADVRLAGQWLSGRSVAPVFEGNRVAADRRSRWWLRGLKWAATRTPLTLRTSAVLIWRELRGTAAFTLWWGLLGVLMVDLLVRAWGGGTNLNWLVATPLLCGLMTCAGDNNRKTFRFLTNRGLHPVAVWLTKHAVWLTLAVGLVLVFGLYDALAHPPEPATPQGDQSVTSMFSRNFVPLESGRAGDRPSLLHFGSLVASLGLALYAVGHLCSLWFRRTVVSMSVAGLCGVVLVIWHFLLARFDVPFRWGTWPLVAALVFASLASVSGWLLESTTWRRRLAQAAWVVLPIGAVVALTLNWRATQVPLVALDFDWQQSRSEMKTTDARWSSQWRRIFGDLAVGYVGHETSFRYRRWEDLLSPLPVLDVRTGKPLDQEEIVTGANQESAMENSYGVMAGDPSDYVWNHLLDSDLRGFAILSDLREMADEVAANPRPINPQVFVELPDPQRTIVPLGQFFVEAAYQYRKLDDLDEAWAVLTDGLRLTGYLADQVIDTQSLMGCWEARRLILQEIHAWAADEGQTAERLQTALIDMTLLQADITAEPMWRNRYAFFRDALEHWDKTSKERMASLIDPYAVAWPAERERVIRLMSVITAGQMHAEQREYFASQYPLSNWPYVSRNATPDDIARWASTTPLLPDDFRSLLDSDAITATEQVTPIVLRLHLHRVETGSLPDSLDGYWDPAERQRDHNGKSGRPFGYLPEGLPAPVLIANGRGFALSFVLPSGTPLLWSPGESQPVRSERGDYYAWVGVPWDSRVSINESLRPHEFLSRERQEGVAPRLMFVVVGHPPW